jgi:hypothetical protein
MKMETQRGVLLCVGANIRDIAASLLSYGKILSGSVSEIFLSDPTAVIDIPGFPAAFLEFELELDTKYYDAKIKLWLQSESFSIESDGAIQALRAITSRLEGIIIKLDPVVGIDSWCSFAIREYDEDELGLQVLLSNDESCNREALMEWSLDHNFELIENTVTDIESIRVASKLREKEGIPRLVEACESTRWSTMEAKDRGRTERTNEPVCPIETVNQASLPVSPTNVGSESRIALNPADAVEAITARTAQLVFTGVDGSSFLDGDEVELFGLAAQPQHNGQTGTVVRFDNEQGRFVVRLGPGRVLSQLLAVRPGNLRSAPAAAATASPSCPQLHDGGGLSDLDAAESAAELAYADSPGHRELERDLGAVEAAIAEVRRAREGAKSLPDDERRNRAADAAMKLLATLGGMESDDE